MKHLYIIFLLISFPIFSQYRLTVSVIGVKASKGNINLAIYDTPEGFLSFDKVFKSTSAMAKEGTTQLAITNLPEGEYALAVFHDKNGNNELDKNFIGIPKEPIGFSKAKMKLFGPPSFKDCAFSLSDDFEVNIVL